MPPRRRSFTRPQDTLTYRKLFVIAVEGIRTEPQYFSLFRQLSINVDIKTLEEKDRSSPEQVLARLESYLKKSALKKNDQAWLVVDKDSWTDNQLSKLVKWSRQNTNFGLALSNPKFEYWLLLHFEEPNSIKSPRDCNDKLKKHIPDYNKSINPRKITRTMVESAIQRAKSRDISTSNSLIPVFPGTTVYKLVEAILNNAK